MELFICKTNIKLKEEVEDIKKIFSTISFISKWNIDLDDIDNVLRVELIENKSFEIKNKLLEAGFFCEELPD